MIIANNQYYHRALPAVGKAPTTNPEEMLVLPSRIIVINDE
jgi:hypothetical protein